MTDAVAAQSRDITKVSYLVPFSFLLEAGSPQNVDPLSINRVLKHVSVGYPTDPMSTLRRIPSVLKVMNTHIGSLDHALFIQQYHYSRSTARNPNYRH
jgi:hypothetical protein